MFKTLMRYLRRSSKARDVDKGDPIYGLPKQSLQDWLSKNPLLKKDYESELLARSLQRRTNHKVRVNEQRLLDDKE